MTPLFDTITLSMIKRLTFSLLLTCLYVPCFSQERFVVRGRILDAESAPVPYCSVSILESRDSTILGGAVSDTEGRYSLHFEQAGRYLLCYDHLAYESCYRTVEVPEAQTLPDVILRPASRHIDEVVVVARNTEYRAGRYEVNMLGNPIVRNRSVMQVLDLLPGLRDLVHQGNAGVGRLYRRPVGNGSRGAFRPSCRRREKRGGPEQDGSGLFRHDFWRYRPYPAQETRRRQFLRQRIFLRVRFPRRIFYGTRPAVLGPVRTIGNIYMCRVPMGRTKRSTAPIPNFAIRDTRSIRRTGGGSPPGISANF